MGNTTMNIHATDKNPTFGVRSIVPGQVSAFVSLDINAQDTEISIFVSANDADLFHLSEQIKNWANQIVEVMIDLSN